jgi:ubiquinone/menaquinone biosynthesis C-methylase UbiE
MDRLRAAGATRLVGIDLSAGMLSVARRQNHIVAQAAVTALPFPDAAFDVAYSFKVLAHVPDIQHALAEIARVVRPGGTMILEFYNRRSLRGVRWKLKHLFGGESTGLRQRETQLFTRYDSFEETLRYLPPTVRLEAVRGAILVTPAAATLKIPGLARVLSLIERRAATSVLARYSGFLILVLRRL